MIEAMKDHPELNAAIVAKGARRAAIWAGIAEHRQKMLPTVHQWREELMKDGWVVRQLYDHEPIEHAWRASRDGYVIHGLARPIPGVRGTVPKPDLCAWGPDGAAVELPDQYTFDAIKAGTLKCGECGREGAPTKSYAFANRCCDECGPKFMARLPSSWAD